MLSEAKSRERSESGNGRVYDALIGSFLSPDNYVQNAGLTQNFNRYSYCLNNPLKYIDPSGYVALKNWDDFWGVVDNLWNSGGGGWDSSSGNITYNSDGGQSGGGVKSGSGFQGSGLPYMLPEATVAAKAPAKNTPTTATYASNSLSPLLGWTNNGINAAAYGAYEAGGSIRLIKGGSLSFQYYASAWTGGSRARIITYNLSKIGTGVGVGTSITGSVMGGINFALSDKSWGDYGQLSISLLSAGLTLGGPTTPIGIGVGVMDLAGGFNGFDWKFPESG